MVVSNTTIPTGYAYEGLVIGSRLGGGNFSKGGRHPPMLVVSPAHVGYVIAKVLVFAWRRFSCRPINYKFGCTFFLHSRPYCGFRLIKYCTLFAYLKNHCLFAMASRLQCETSSKSWKNTRIYLQYSLFYRIV